MLIAKRANWRVLVQLKSGTGVLPVNHAQDARATTKLNLTIVWEDQT